MDEYFRQPVVVSLCRALIPQAGGRAYMRGFRGVGAARPGSRAALPLKYCRVRIWDILAVPPSPALPHH